MIRTLVVGYGYWGRVITTNLLQHSEFFVSGVTDPDVSARRDADSANLYTFRTMTDALDQTHVDLVVICSPIGTMMPLAHEAIQRYANVMMAKPGPQTIAEAENLIKRAMMRGVLVSVDYTMLMSKRFGDFAAEARAAASIVATRVSAGSRSSAHIFDDMMIHDLAIISESDPSAQWLVIGADSDESSGKIELVSRHGVRALLRADRSEKTIRMRRVSARLRDGSMYEWDQLADDDQPFTHRLDWLAYQIRTHGLGNTDEIMRVTRLLEKSHAALDSDHLA